MVEKIFDPERTHHCSVTSISVIYLKIIKSLLQQGSRGKMDTHPGAGHFVTEIVQYVWQPVHAFPYRLVGRPGNLAMESPGNTCLDGNRDGIDP